MAYDDSVYVALSALTIIVTALPSFASRRLSG